MTWAPTETQKEIYEALSTDNGLAQLLGVVAQKQFYFSAIPDAGAFTLNYGVQTTAQLNAPITSAAVQSALRGLLGLESVTVTGAGTVASPFLITFLGVEGVVSALSEASNTLTASAVPVTITITTVSKAQKVFDFVPDNEEFPYVTMQVLPFNDRGNHTKAGWQCEFQINVWYRAPGRGKLQVQRIQAAIDSVLHLADLCVDGWNNLGLRRTLVDILVEDDNVTLHGIQRFNLLLGEA